MGGITHHTKLMYHFDSDFIDSSPSENTILSSTDVVFSPGKFSNAAAFSNSAVLIINYSTELYIGTNSWTLDFWAKDLGVELPYYTFKFFDSQGLSFAYVAYSAWSYPANTPKFILTLDNGIDYDSIIWDSGISAVYEEENVVFTNSIFDPAEWNHFAISCNGTQATFYINGISQGSQAFAYDIVNLGTNSSIHTDSYCQDPLAPLLLDELRLNIGTESWESSFIPPIEPYSLEAESSLTKLLLHMNAVDESQIFVDSSTVPHTVEVFGDVKQDTGWFQLGTASAQFSANGDYLSISDVNNWEIFNDPFTIHFWYRPTANAVQRLFSQIVDATTYIACDYDSRNPTITFTVCVYGVKKIEVQVTAYLEPYEFSHIAIIGR